MTVLVKSQTVLKLSEATADGTFYTDAEEDVVSSRVVGIDRQTWLDLGRPASITVTIEPGDTLNPEDDFLSGATCNPDVPEDCEACQ